MGRFQIVLAEAKKSKSVIEKPHSDDAFNKYLNWFLRNTRVQILENAYPEGILDEPVFDKLGTLAYNKLVREGRQTSFAPVVNFVVSWEVHIRMTTPSMLM